jgi:tetratricopeptide (TPR) repeat protein
VAKYTQEDISNIARRMRQSKDENKPFHILTGAGCSVSAGIPLAQTLVAKIKEEYGVECVKRLAPEKLNNYGDCMSCLSKSERRDLIKPYLDEAKINWAHIALAAMMDGGFIDRVLTFNFDSVLAKACGLHGLYPATYDFAAAPSRETNYIASPAIIHLHGQGFARVMLNTDEETTAHAVALSPLIANTLDSAPLLVAGYSGQSDAVFPVLQHEYSGQQRLYWAGYDYEPTANVSQLLEKGGNTALYLGGADADQFFMDIARALECWPPKLFKNPYAQLLDELKDVADFPLAVGSGEDLLTKLKNELQTVSVARTENTTPDLNLLMMEEKWDDVIKFADEKKPEEAHLKAWAFAMLGNGLWKSAELRKDAALFNESFVKFARAVLIEPNMHAAFNNWGVALADLAQIKESEEQRQEAEALFKDSFAKYACAIKIKPDKHEAFNNWGTALAHLAQLNGRQALYFESFAKYACAIEIKPDNYSAFLNWGNALSGLAQLNGVKGLFEESFEKYANAVAIKPDLPEAFYNWGNGLLALARQEKDPALFKESFEKYARAIEIEPDKHSAIHNWGAGLIELARLEPDEAIIDLALVKLLAAEVINPAIVYTLACAFALKNNIPECRARLQTCKAAGTLPLRTEMLADADLANVHAEDWFQELIADLPE